MPYSVIFDYMYHVLGYLHTPECEHSITLLKLLFYFSPEKSFLSEGL